MRNLQRFYRLTVVVTAEPDCHNSCAKTAEMIADAVLADIRKPYDEKMTLMKNIALPKRYELWEKLGILPDQAEQKTRFLMRL